MRDLQEILEDFKNYKKGGKYYINDSQSSLGLPGRYLLCLELRAYIDKNNVSDIPLETMKYLERAEKRMLGSHQNTRRLITIPLRRGKVTMQQLEEAGIVELIQKIAPDAILEIKMREKAIELEKYLKTMQLSGDVADVYIRSKWKKNNLAQEQYNNTGIQMRYKLGFQLLDYMTQHSDFGKKESNEYRSYMANFSYFDEIMESIPKLAGNFLARMNTSFSQENMANKEVITPFRKNKVTATQLKEAGIINSVEKFFPELLLEAKIRQISANLISVVNTSKPMLSRRFVPLEQELFLQLMDCVGKHPNFSIAMNTIPNEIINKVVEIDKELKSDFDTRKNILNSFKEHKIDKVGLEKLQMQDAFNSYFPEYLSSSLEIKGDRSMPSTIPTPTMPTMEIDAINVENITEPDISNIEKKVIDPIIHPYDRTSARINYRINKKMGDSLDQLEKKQQEKQNFFSELKQESQKKIKKSYNKLNDKRTNEFDKLFSKVEDQHNEYRKLTSKKKTFFWPNKKREQTIAHVDGIIKKIQELNVEPDVKIKLLYGCILANKNSVTIHQKEKDLLSNSKIREFLGKTTSRLVTLYDDLLDDVEKAARECDVSLNTSEVEFRETFSQQIKEDFTKGKGL